jgi:hypothetical protein
MTSANDTVTEQALIRLANSAQHTIDSLSEALIAARRVRDHAKAAQTRLLDDSDMGAIMGESLRMNSSLSFAMDHGGLVTSVIGKIDAHREGQPGGTPE